VKVVVEITYHDLEKTTRSYQAILQKTAVSIWEVVAKLTGSI